MERSLGRFTLVRELGRGGTAEVWEASDRELGRKVALKLLRDDRPAARLRAEACVMARVSHPNVAVIYDAGELDGQPYIAMELMAETLRTWLGDRVRSRREIIDAYIAAARGLAAAHASGVVHRDFKPDNVLVDGDGHVKVGDFGLADERAELVATDPLTTASRFGGTPAYMAPEVLLGHPSDARSDQFAFAVSLWEALGGRRPFASGETDLDTVAAHLAAITDRRFERPARHLPRSVERVLRRALAADPAARFPSMAALIAALRPRWPLRAAVILAAAAAITFLVWPAHAVPTRELAYVRELDSSSDAGAPPAVISRDGTRVAIVSPRTNHVQIFDEHGQQVANLAAPPGLVSHATAFADDGSMLLLGRTHDAWEVWRLATTPVLLGRIDPERGFKDSTRYDHGSVVADGDGALVALGNVFEVRDGTARELAHVDSPAGAYALRRSPHGRLISLGFDDRIRLWTTSHFEPITPADPCGAVRTADWVDDHVVITSSTTGEGSVLCRVDIDHPGGATVVASAPAGELIEELRTSERGLALRVREPQLEILLRETDGAIHALELPLVRHPRIAAWQDPRTLLLQTADRVLEVDVGTGEEHATLQRSALPILAGSDELLLEDDRVHVRLHVAGGDASLAFESIHDPEVLCAAASRPPCLLALLEGSDRVYRWLDPHTLALGDIAYRGPVAHTHNAYGEALSPDGTSLARASSTGLHLVDLRSHAERTLAADVAFQFVAWDANGRDLLGSTVPADDRPSRLVRVAPDETVTDLTTSDGVIGFPLASPTGRIAFEILRLHYRTELARLP